MAHIFLTVICDYKDLLQADESAARLFLKESKVHNCDQTILQGY